MLLLGVLQAQAAGQVAAGSFDLLETQVLTSSAASVTFSSLSTYAADYQHLQIRIVSKVQTGYGRLGNLFGSMETQRLTTAHDFLRGNGSSVSSKAQV
jgi:hypothetical protein